jgi:hypothetical protein
MAVSASAGENLVTLSDIVNKLQYRAGQLDGEDRMEKLLVFAARDAIRDLPSQYSWKYYQRTFRIVPSPVVNIASLVYTASSGEATISNDEPAVWPSDAIYGEVTINNSRYKVDRVVSSKVAKISGPPASYSGKSEWSRSEYKIPNVRRLHLISEDGTNRVIEYAMPQQIHYREMLYQAPGTPIFYTIMSGESECVIKFSPPPQIGSRDIVASASIAPAYPKIFRDTLLATGTSGQKLLTGTAKKAWVGSVVRLSSNQSDSDDGRLKTIEGEYEWQSIITDVQGSNVTVADPLPRNLDADFCLVSSPIDISVTMQTYYEALAYSYFCRSHKHDGLPDAMKLASMTLREAQAADSIANRSTMHPDVLVSKYWPIEDLKSQWVSS